MINSSRLIIHHSPSTFICPAGISPCITVISAELYRFPRTMPLRSCWDGWSDNIIRKLRRRFRRRSNGASTTRQKSIAPRSFPPVNKNRKKFFSLWLKRIRDALPYSMRVGSACRAVTYHGNAAALHFVSISISLEPTGKTANKMMNAGTWKRRS